MAMASLLCWLLLFVSTAAASSNFSYPDTIMKSILHKYKSNERPMENNQTLVTVYMKVLAINSIDVIKMEYSTDVYLRQEWMDMRLAWDRIPLIQAFNSNIVSPSLKDKMWLPDLFFRNGKKGYVHTMTTPNYLLRIKPNGEVLYSQKITMRFSCQMELQTFPMDTQECHMDVGSYGYTLDQLRFRWRLRDAMTLPAQPMQIPEFNQPKQVETTDCSAESSTTTGNYSCIKATFYLQRQLGSYLASTYVPNVLIVMVSWLNFWVSIEAVPARITLGLLTLLGMLTQATGISTNLPRVSYIKAIDVWIIACILFVIGALIEFAVASMISRRHKPSVWRRDVEGIVHEELLRWSRRGGAGAASSVSGLDSGDHQQGGPRRRQPPLALLGLEAALGSGRDRETVCRQLEGLLTAQLISGGPRTHKQHHHHQKRVGPGHHQPHRSNKKQLVSEPPVMLESEIDSYSQFLFPAFFMLYNCFYWLYYLIQVHKRNVEMGLA